MIEDLLVKDESKTLEFKENLNPLAKIIQTIIAFANTADGVIVVGIKDRLFYDELPSHQTIKEDLDIKET